MSKFKIVNLIDKLFITFSSFLIIYAWLNFYIRDLGTTFILSFIFSLSITYIIFFLLNKKKDKKFLTAKQNEEINKNFLAFKLMTNKEKIKLLNKILSADFETKATSKMITYEKDNQTCSLIIATNLQKIKQEDLINLLEEHNTTTNRIEIICNEFDSNINTKIIKNLNIILINKTKLYLDFFQKHNTYPDTSILNEKELKLNWKIILKNLLTEQKAKRYFILGFVLIFSALILPFKTYYLIFGTGFLICSILCKLLPKFKN